MKWVSITALLLAVFLPPFASYQVLLQILVPTGALFVVLQSGRAARYYWAAAFIAVAVLYNPIVPVVLSRSTFILLDLVCVAAFAASLVALKSMAIRPLPSIARRAPYGRVSASQWRVS